MDNSSVLRLMRLMDTIEPSERRVASITKSVSKRASIEGIRRGKHLLYSRCNPQRVKDSSLYLSKAEPIQVGNANSVDTHEPQACRSGLSTTFQLYEEGNHHHKGPWRLFWTGDAVNHWWWYRKKQEHWYCIYMHVDLFIFLNIEVAIILPAFVSFSPSPLNVASSAQL